MIFKHVSKLLRYVQNITSFFLCPMAREYMTDKQERVSIWSVHRVYWWGFTDSCTYLSIVNCWCVLVVLDDNTAYVPIGSDAGGRYCCICWPRCARWGWLYRSKREELSVTVEIFRPASDYWPFGGKLILIFSAYLWCSLDALWK